VKRMALFGMQNIHVALFGMQNMTFGPYSAAKHRVLICLISPHGVSCVSLKKKHAHCFSSPGKNCTSGCNNRCRERHPTHLFHPAELLKVWEGNRSTAPA
jgi:hypothetical protein